MVCIVLNCHPLFVKHSTVHRLISVEDSRECSREVRTRTAAGMGEGTELRLRIYRRCTRSKCTQHKGTVHLITRAGGPNPNATAFFFTLLFAFGKTRGDCCGCCNEQYQSRGEEMCVSFGLLSTSIFMFLPTSSRCCNE